MLSCNFEVTHNFVYKLVYRWYLQVEIDLDQDNALHMEKLCYRIDTITELHILLRLNSINFIVFAANKQASDT